jgi:hypothetical protein
LSHWHHNGHAKAAISKRPLQIPWSWLRSFHRIVIAGALLLAVPGCGTETESDPAAIHKIAFTDGLNIALTADPAEPSSGEARGVPELVYTGRQSRVAVTLTDSDVGVPVGGLHVAAKVVATRWIGALRPLAPVSPQEGRYEASMELPAHGPYRIDVEVEYPGGSSTIQFGFDY